MLHGKKSRKFGLEKDSRRALKRLLALNLIRDGKIKTTEAKAKEIRPLVEKLVTRAKHDTVANRRLIVSRIGSPSMAKKLFVSIAPKYKDRNGGYTRITKLVSRTGDAAKVAVIEFV